MAKPSGAHLVVTICLAIVVAALWGGPWWGTLACLVAIVANLVATKRTGEK